MDKAQKVAKGIPRSRKDFLGNEMTDRAKISAWLDHIGEDDDACRNEVFEHCKADKGARAYYVGRYETRGEHDRAAGSEA